MSQLCATPALAPITCTSSPCHARLLVPPPLVLVVALAIGIMSNLTTWFSPAISWMLDVAPRKYYPMVCAKKPASCTACCAGLMVLPPGAERPARTRLLLVVRLVEACACVYIVRLSLYCTSGLVLAVCNIQLIC